MSSGRNESKARLVIRASLCDWDMSSYQPLPVSASTSKQKPKQRNCLGLYLAEKEGFEPSVQSKLYAGFRIRCIRPLCHLSVSNPRF